MGVQCQTCKREFAGERYYKGHLFGWKNTKCLLGQVKYCLPGFKAPIEEMGSGTRLPAPETGTATRLAVPEGEVCEPTARNDHEAPEQPGCDGAVGMEEAGLEDAIDELVFEDAMEEPLFEDAMEAPLFEDAMEELGLEESEEGDDEDDHEAGEEGEEREGEEGEGKRLILEEFQKYVEHSKKNNLELTRPFVAGVKLMKLLADKGCPMCLYDEIMQWHVDFSDASERVSRKVLRRKGAFRAMVLNLDVRS